MWSTGDFSSPDTLFSSNPGDASQLTSIHPSLTESNHLSGLSDPPSDTDTFMDWADEEALTTASALKRKQHALDYAFLSPLSILDPSSLSSTGPSPSKKSRQSQHSTPHHNPPDTSELSQSEEMEFSEAGTSLPLESPLERDSFVADLESCLDSILNQLADDTRQRESSQESYTLSLSGIVSDSPPAENSALSFHDNAADFALNLYDNASDELSQSLFDTRFQSLNLGAESAGPDSEPHAQLDGEYDEVRDNIFDDAVADDQGSNSGSTEVPTPFFEDSETWPGELNDDEMDQNPTPKNDSEFKSEDSRSRCPCNQCSPRAPTHPDYHPSLHSQEEIHRLFSLSPFA
ncbi:hypothetical protein B0H19DRAFT_692169 [Mycena capillaripes]|nr:hypothetical protein B0H19DRAFT_692169 [Mycena capillaripes]